MASELIDFESERYRHGPLLGREDLLAELDKLLLGKGAKGWVLVKGTPGRGKSALLAEWWKRHEGREGLGLVVHFLRRGEEQWERPEVVRRNLAAQVERLYPEQADAEARPESRLRELLQRVSRQVLVPKGQRLVLVVDGLDEAEVGEDGAPPLPRFLPDTLPRRVVVLCASRPTYPYLSWLEGKAPQVSTLDLDGEQWRGSNEAVVREYWSRATQGDQALRSPALIEEVVRRSAGNVLYTVKLAARLEGPEAQQWRAELLARGPEVLPQGLEKLLDEMWTRLLKLPDDLQRVVREGLWVVAAAREALPLAVIAKIAGWGRHEDEIRFLREARPYLLEKLMPGTGEKAWRPHHDSLRSYVLRMLGQEREKEWHKRLAENLCRWPADEGAETWKRSYALRHGVMHWLSAGQWQKARELYTNVNYLTSQCEEVGVLAVEENLYRVAEQVPGAESRIPRELCRAIQADSHALRREPGVLARSLYNRLLCKGWSTKEIRRELRFPGGLPALRLRRPVRAGNSTRTLEGHSAEVNGCVVTPDGQHVVSCSSDYTLKVWDLETGRELSTLEGHDSVVNGCAVTPDGRYVVSCSSDGTLKVWDLKTGRELHTLEGHDDVVSGCAVTPDGQRVVSCSYDATLSVWDLEDGTTRISLEASAFQLTGCAVTPDGRRMVSSSFGGELTVWDLETGQELALLMGHMQGVTRCAVTPDGRQVISCSSDKDLKVWDLKSGRELASLEEHNAAVNDCVVMPDGRHLVSCSEDKKIMIWDLRTRQVVATLEGHSASVSGCAVTPNGRYVVSCSKDKTLKVWDWRAARELADVGEGGFRVGGCAVTPDGKCMVSCHGSALKAWDLETGRELATLRGHSAMVTGCAMMPDGRRVVSYSWDDTVRMWDLKSGQELDTIKVRSSLVNGCVVTPDGKRLVLYAQNTALKVLDLETGRELVTLNGHRGRVSGCAVTPDGLCVVSCSADGMLKVWDLGEGRELVTLSGHDEQVSSCTVTPTGQHVVSFSCDGVLKVWELKTGLELITLKAHRGRVTGCAVAPDGLSIVSCSEDATLKVWDLNTGKCLHTLYGYSAFSSVAITPSVICAGDALGNVWVVELEPDTSMPNQSTKIASSSGAPMVFPFPKPLIEAYHSKQLALFIGSGLSLAKDVRGNFPSWSQLPLRLLEGCETFSKLPESQLKAKREAFQEGMPLRQMLAELGTLRTALGRQYQRVLNEIFRHGDPDPGEAHRAVARLEVQALLTTNYDQLIESLTERPRRQPYTWRHAANALGDLQRGIRILLKVHGSAEDDESIVMTQTEYDRAHSDGSYQKVLSYLLQTYTFLFIGYGMNDPLDLDLALEGNADAFRSATRVHYALMKRSDDKARDQRDKERYMEAYNVEVLFYDSHEQIPEILDALRHEAGKLGAPTP